MSELLDVNKDDKLPSLGKGKEKKRPRKNIYRLVIQLICWLAFVLILSISAQVTYDFTRYSKFYVNGESMYPTLNKNTEVFSDGKKVEEKTYLIGNFSQRNHQYICDYGLMDTKEGFISTVKRFSIVVTYYNSDMLKKGNSYSPSSNAELKIKRVIGMPGEELYFDSFGELYIKGKNETSFSKVDQSFLDIESWDDDSKEFLSKAKKETNENSTYANSESNAYKLGEDEYFLVGDNRLKGASNDSRMIGAVNSYSFVGKVITIIGKCKYSIDSEGNSKETIELGSIIMPWRLDIL